MIRQTTSFVSNIKASLSKSGITVNLASRQLIDNIVKPASNGFTHAIASTSLQFLARETRDKARVTGGVFGTLMAPLVANHLTVDVYSLPLHLSVGFFAGVGFVGSAIDLLQRLSQKYIPAYLIAHPDVISPAFLGHCNRALCESYGLEQELAINLMTVDSDQGCAFLQKLRAVDRERYIKLAHHILKADDERCLDLKATLGEIFVSDINKLGYYDFAELYPRTLLPEFVSELAFSSLSEESLTREGDITNKLNYIVEAVLENYLQESPNPLTMKALVVLLKETVWTTLLYEYDFIVNILNKAKKSQANEFQQNFYYLLTVKLLESYYKHLENAGIKPLRNTSVIEDIKEKRLEGHYYIIAVPILVELGFVDYFMIERNGHNNNELYPLILNEFNVFFFRDNRLSNSPHTQLRLEESVMPYHYVFEVEYERMGGFAVREAKKIDEKKVSRIDDSDRKSYIEKLNRFYEGVFEQAKIFDDKPTSPPGIVDTADESQDEGSGDSQPVRIPMS